MKSPFPFFLLLISISNTIYAQEQSDIISLMKGRDSISLVGEKIYYLEDPEGELSIEDILSEEYQAGFQKNEGAIFVRPLNNRVYWLKMIVQNQSEEDLYIEIKNQSLWYLDYYVVENNQSRHLVSAGSQREAKFAPYPSNFYWLKLEKSKNIQVVYLRIQTLAAFFIPISVGYLPQLFVQKSYYDFVFYAFIGIMITMIIYNLSLYISIHDIIYLIYTMYLFIVLLQIPTFNGYPIIANLFGNEVRFYIFKYFLFWSSTLYLLVFLFMVYFLDLRKKSPWVYYTNTSYILIICLVLPICNLFQLLPYVFLIITHQVMTLGYYLLAFGSSLYLWLIKNDRNAFFYTIAWVWVVAGNFIIVLVFNGFLPYNYFTYNAHFLGIILEILFFSIALGDRFNRMRKQKEEVLEENIKIIENQKSILEQKVAERTRELQIQLANYALRLAEESDYYQEVQKMVSEENYANNAEQIIRKIKNRKDPSTEWDNFRQMFEQLHPGFYSNLLKMAPSLTPQELKLASLLKVNLSSKEIASILNINGESVFKARYRLRKKLKIENEDNLVIFLINLS